MHKAQPFKQAFGLFATGLASFAFAAVCLTANSAAAATRTVCFELMIRDNVRTDCPLPGTAGARRICRPASGYDYAIGYEVSLWDKDPGDGSGDEFIGTWHIGGSGQQCVTFEWENASYSLGEADPDVYISINNRATASWGDGTTVVDIQVANGTQYGDVSWRNGDGVNPDAYVFNNCHSGSCRILPGAGLVPTNDTASNYGVALLALDSAQHVLEVFHNQMDDGVINLEFPSDEPNCPVGNACAISRTLVSFTTQAVALSGANSAHEVGHVVQMQMFEQNTLTDDCSWNGNGHALTSIEWQSCATTEGWADYAAAVSWWNPATSTSVPVLWGFNFEAAALTDATCTTNAWIEGQVARAFWDIDDVNNEAGTVDASGDGVIDNDISNVATTSLATGWDNFPDGTGNNQDRESDSNGVNAIDYDANFNLNDTTFRHHNCIGSQDPN